MTEHEIKERFAAALAETDEDRRWDIVVELQMVGTRAVFEAASELLKANDDDSVRLAADVLAQIGASGPFAESIFRIKAVDALHGFLRSDFAAMVDHVALASVVKALGWLRTEEALSAVRGFAGHPSEEVRYAVSFSLFSDDDQKSIDLLLGLSRDSDIYVRDWAVTGLAYAEHDSPELREALLERLAEDGHEISAEIRGEALTGLAIRKDARVLEPLKRELAREDFHYSAVDAAREFASPALFEVLLDLADVWPGNEEILNEAIAACRISAAPEAGVQ